MNGNCLPFRLLLSTVHTHYFVRSRSLFWIFAVIYFRLVSFCHYCCTYLRGWWSDDGWVVDGWWMVLSR